MGVLRKTAHRMQGNDVVFEQQIDLSLPIGRGHRGGPRNRSTRRLIGGPADHALFRDFIRASGQMQGIATRVRQNPFQLFLRRVTQIHMKLHDELLGPRRATIRRIPQGNRLARRGRT